MFFQGALQEGISTAVGQQKLVLCFITDEEEESQQWEDEFLTDESLTTLINKQAVALRLKAGSDEAGYLAQIFPIPQTPTVVLMKHGELKEYVASGTNKEEFIRRVQNAFSGASQASTSASTSAAAATTTTTAAVPASASASTQSTTTSTTSPNSQSSESVSRVLAERAARMKVAKEEAERKVQEEREKAKAKAKADIEAGVESQAASALKQAELVKKNKQQAMEERRRILKKIKDDKEERRAKALEREQIRMDSQKIGDISSALANAPESKIPSTIRLGSTASLQVRLFDGTTIRSRFNADQPMKDVRDWVDKEKKSDKVAYRFKHMLTPLPNKNIDDTEEAQTLHELGLAPSSTLVLIPVQQFVDAYGASSGASSFLNRLFALFMSFLTFISGLVGFGGRTRRGEAGESHGESSSTAQARKERTKRFDDESKRKDQQLYNGNSTNFESRGDDAEDSQG